MRNSFILRVLLAAAVLVVLLSSAAPVFAQEKVNLNFNVLGPFPGDITPGSTHRVFAELRNNGTTEITNIRFSHNAPEGWTIVFEPAALSSLTPGSSNTVDVIITAAESVRNGDYSIALVADADQSRAVASLFLIVDEENYLWILIGAGIVVLVIIGFIIIFLRFGK